MKPNIAVVILVLKICVNVGLAEDVLVKLPDGAILGNKVESYSGKPYYNFQKIPYAAPPVGDLRFKAPVLPEKWDDVLNTTYLDKICHQLPPQLPEEDEDCLYINVYTPGLPSDDNEVSVPVLLFIYGGGHQGHALPYRWGPEYLIDYDVIVVTFNFRAGPFGYLSTGDAVVSGNTGLKDQQFAIKWVHDNIHLFGGDPAKITIVGVSSGGISVSHQLLNKNSEGLFRAAIMESGTALLPPSLERNPREDAWSLASLLNSNITDKDDSESLVEFLLTVTAEDLLAAAAQIVGWAPVIEVEHDGAFITKKMYGLIESGNFMQVPILMGINSEESLYAAAAQAESYDNDLRTLVPDDISMAMTNDSLLKFGLDVQLLYCNDTFSNDIAAVVRYQSDNIFNRNIIRCAELSSKFTDVYFYQFSYDGPLGNVTISIEGAEHVNHAEEIRYIWRTTEDGYDNSDLSKYPPEDVVTQHRMLTLWTNFVKTMNPTPEPEDILQNITWPTVNSNPADFPYLYIGEDLLIKNHPKGDTYNRWVALYNMILKDSHIELDTY